MSVAGVLGSDKSADEFCLQRAERGEQGEPLLGLWPRLLHFPWVSKTCDQEPMKCQPVRNILGHSIFHPSQARGRNIVVTDEEGHVQEIEQHIPALS